MAQDESRNPLDSIVEEYLAGKRDWDSLYADVIEIVESTQEKVLTELKDKTSISLKHVGGIVERLREIIAEKEAVIEEKDRRIRELEEELGSRR
ncbi:MAG: hypothetical protein ACTSU5_21015 [Promethearchaeota archaeon]